MKMQHQPQIKTEEDHHNLYEAIAALQSAEEARQFLHDLCTPGEVQAMTDRWKVVDLIKTGKPYRKIYDETGVSSTTVGRVARFLTMGAGGYELIYNRLKQKKKDEKQ